MPATRTQTRRARPTPAARERAEADAQRLEQIQQMLDVAQRDLASIGGSVGTGVRDLRRDVTKLLRDARRDVTKMSRAVRRDLERLQRDLTAAANGKPATPARKPAAKRPTRTARRQTAH
jgi:hypothetical protein